MYALLKKNCNCVYNKLKNFNLPTFQLTNVKIVKCMTLFEKNPNSRVYILNLNLTKSTERRSNARKLRLFNDVSKSRNIIAEFKI